MNATDHLSLRITAAKAPLESEIERLKAEIATRDTAIACLKEDCAQLQTSHARLLDNLRTFVASTFDPGTEALSAIWCAEQLRPRAAVQAATTQQGEPHHGR